jgi:hypothetical protein
MLTLRVETWGFSRFKLNWRHLLALVASNNETPPLLREVKRLKKAVVNVVKS